MAKDLFGDDSSDDGQVTDTTVHVNNAYATKYDQVKRKQELQRLASKYGHDAGVGSSDESSEDEDEGSEDDDAHYLTSKKETAFAEVFHKLRTMPDVIVKEKQTRFFDLPDVSDDDEADADADKRAAKPFLLKDAYQKGLVEGGTVEDTEARDESVIRKLKPSSKQEKKLRDAFLDATKDTTDNFEVKLIAKGPKPSRKEAAKSTSAILLQEAFQTTSNTKDEEDDKFLQRFFVQELWRPAEGEDDEDAQDWEAMAKEEEDEIFFDDAEQWEREFQEKQFRHEDGDAALTVQTFSRTQEGVLRKKDVTRKQARERRDERKQHESTQQVEELKRLKTLKRKEIEEQKALIAKVAGIKDISKLGITREFLEQDFDPATFDKQMAALFDHDYDHDFDDEEQALFDDEHEPDEDEVDEDDAEAAGGSDVDDTFADTLEESIALAAKAGRGKQSNSRANKYLADDELAMLYPDEALKALEELPSGAAPTTSSGKSKEDLEKDLEKKVDDYWKLHYHKVAGDVRTRFRYRDVNAESFGLTDIDVLTKDDRQLNMIAPLNCYAPYLGKNENTRDRYKAMHRRNNLREISSDRKSRRYGEVGKTALLNADITEEEGQKVAEQIRERTKRIRDDFQDDSTERPPSRKAHPSNHQNQTTNSKSSHAQSQPHQRQPFAVANQGRGKTDGPASHGGQHRPRRQ